MKRNRLTSAALAAGLALSAPTWTTAEETEATPTSDTETEEPASSTLSRLFSDVAANDVEMGNLGPDVDCAKTAPSFIRLPDDADPDNDVAVLSAHGCSSQPRMFGLVGGGIGNMFMPYVAVRIISEPVEASVYIDDQLLGSTNIRGMVKKRTLAKLTVRKEGYRDCPFATDLLLRPNASASGDAEFHCALEPLEDAE